MVWALLLAKDANTRATIASFPNASITPDQYYNIQITLSFVSLESGMIPTIHKANTCYLI